MRYRYRRSHFRRYHCRRQSSRDIFRTRFRTKRYTTADSLQVMASLWIHVKRYRYGTFNRYLPYEVALQGISLQRVPCSLQEMPSKRGSTSRDVATAGTLHLTLYIHDFTPCVIALWGRLAPWGRLLPHGVDVCPMG